MGANKLESENSPEEEKPLNPEEADTPKPKATPKPKTKTFRILNTSYQTLYLTLPGRTLVLDRGTSQDVPESDVAGNAHVKVMVRRGHIALFEY